MEPILQALLLHRVDNIRYLIKVNTVCMLWLHCYGYNDVEYISGQRSWFDGMMVPENDALWMMKPPHSQGSKVMLP